MSGVMTQAFTQSFQRQAQLNPNVSPPPPELLSSMTSMMSGVLVAAAVIGVAICAVIVIGALARGTWMFWAVLVLLGLGALGPPINLYRPFSTSPSSGSLHWFPTRPLRPPSPVRPPRPTP